MEGIPSLTGHLPCQAGGLILDFISLEDLLSLWVLEREEGFERITCRPVKNRTEAERTALFYDALGDSTKLLCGLYLSERGGVVGKITASDWNPRNRSAEIGYFLHPAYRGKGLMCPALAAFCSTLLETLCFHKLYAQTGAFNRPSIRLLEAVGFQRDGVLRRHHELGGILMDDYLYCLLNGESIT